MNYAVVLLEQVHPKYCKPGEKIVHEYFLQGFYMNGRLAAYNRSLYTHEYLCKGSEEFDCDLFPTMKEAREWKKQVKAISPDKKFKILRLTDEEVFQRSTACLKRAEA